MWPHCFCYRDIYLVLWPIGPGLCDRDFKKLPQSGIDCTPEPWMYGTGGKSRKEICLRKIEVYVLFKQTKPNQSCNVPYRKAQNTKGKRSQGEQLPLTFPAEVSSGYLPM